MARDAVTAESLFLNVVFLLQAIEAVQRSPTPENLSGLYDAVEEGYAPIVTQCPFMAAAEPVEVGRVVAASTPLAVFRYARQLLLYAVALCQSEENVDAIASAIMGRGLDLAIFAERSELIAAGVKQHFPPLVIDQITARARIECLEVKSRLAIRDKHAVIGLLPLPRDDFMESAKLLPTEWVRLDGAERLAAIQPSIKGKGGRPPKLAKVYALDAELKAKAGGTPQMRAKVAVAWNKKYPRDRIDEKTVSNARASYGTPDDS